MPVYSPASLAGYLAGHALTVADLKFATAYRSYVTGDRGGVPASTLEPYPALLALYTKVAELPQVCTREDFQRSSGGGPGEGGRGEPRRKWEGVARREEGCAWRCQASWRCPSRIARVLSAAAARLTSHLAQVAAYWTA